MLAFLFLAISLSGFSQSNINQDELTANYWDWIKVYRNSQVGYIDQYGVEVVAPVYDSIHKFGTHKKDWALTQSDGLYGFIDDQGNDVVLVQYEQINTFGEYQDGWALVKKEGYFGFIDESGTEVVIPQYDRIEQITKHAKAAN